MCLFLVVLIIVLEFQMNIIEIEDKKKYTKSSGINSIEFFISWDSMYVLYIIFYISLTYCILYMFTFNMYI